MSGREVAVRRVLSGSVWILVGVALQSGLGMAFWVLGAQVGSPAQLGRASELYADLQFVNFASGLGLTVALARDAVGDGPDDDVLLGWAVIATVVASFVAGLAFLALVQTPATRSLAAGSRGALVFCLYTAGMSIALLADVRLMAARAWPWLVGRIVLVGLVRLALLPLVSPSHADAWLYHLMLAPLALGGIAALVLLPRAGAGGCRVGRSLRLASVSRFAGVSWVATLASQAPQFALPVVVARFVDPGAFAGFFLAWTVTGLVVLAPAAIAQMLLIEGGRAPIGPARPNGGRLPPATLASLALAIGALVGAQAGRVVLGHLAVTGLIQAASRWLPGLLAGGVPWALTALWLTDARLRADHLATVATTAAIGVGTIGLAWRWVPTGGVAAAVHAWWWGQGLALVVGAICRRRHGRGARPILGSPRTPSTQEVAHARPRP